MVTDSYSQLRVSASEVSMDSYSILFYSVLFRLGSQLGFSPLLHACTPVSSARNHKPKNPAPGLTYVYMYVYHKLFTTARPEKLVCT